MAVINGNDLGIYVGGTLIACITGANWSSSRAEIDVTCKDDSGNRAVILGGLTTNITFSGFFKADASYGVEDLLDIYLAKTEVSLMFGDGTNLSLYQQAYLQEFSIDAPLNAGAQYSGKFSATGTPVKTET